MHRLNSRLHLKDLENIEIFFLTRFSKASTKHPNLNDYRLDYSVRLRPFSTVII